MLVDNITKRVEQCGGQQLYWSVPGSTASWGIGCLKHPAPASSNSHRIAIVAMARPASDRILDGSGHIIGVLLFIAVALAALLFVVHSIGRDMHASNSPPLATGTLVLLGLALFIALGFEFVNGFHDTANAVATVIYTYSMPARAAVVWSGTFNFLGVLTSSGAVAFTVVNLLPVELILQASSGDGFDMIFSLLIAAILWNVGTWWLGLPASSSHTLIGSIIGVGVVNELMAEPGSGASGVDWSQAAGVFKALLFSPVIGFIGASLLFLIMRSLVRNKTLYAPPTGNKPPPIWIRLLLIFTCTGVSFAHGSNDGQKGMGLIMLILIGALPTAYALNRSMPASYVPAFIQASQEIQHVFTSRAGRTAPVPVDQARTTVIDALKLKEVELVANVRGIGLACRQYRPASSKVRLACRGNRQRQCRIFATTCSRLIRRFSSCRNRA